MTHVKLNCNICKLFRKGNSLIFVNLKIIRSTKWQVNVLHVIRSIVHVVIFGFRGAKRMRIIDSPRWDTSPSTVNTHHKTISIPSVWTDTWQKKNVSKEKNNSVTDQWMIRIMIVINIFIILFPLPWDLNIFQRTTIFKSMLVCF